MTDRKTVPIFLGYDNTRAIGSITLEVEFFDQLAENPFDYDLCMVVDPDPVANNVVGASLAPRPRLPRK